MDKKEKKERNTEEQPENGVKAKWGALWIFVFVSVGTMIACLLALLIPTAFITKVRPAKTIRVE